MISFFTFILGAIVGSFLNVVILRYNTGLPIMHGKARSKCFSCGKILTAKELIPILSYVMQGGKCSVCKSKISIQYPLVELLTGFFFWLTYMQTGISLVSVFSVTITSILLVIAVYDIRHKIIPDGLVYAFIAMSLVFSLWMWNPQDFLAGPIFSAIFFALWYVSRGTWLGFGDVKLVLGIGFLLGLMPGLSALLLSFWIGAVVSLGLIVVQKVLLRQGGKALTMKSEIPFAPFLILGTLLVYYFGIEAYRIASLFT